MEWLKDSNYQPPVCVACGGGVTEGDAIRLMCLRLLFLLLLLSLFLFFLLTVTVIVIVIMIVLTIVDPSYLFHHCYYQY